MKTYIMMAVCFVCIAVGVTIMTTYANRNDRRVDYHTKALGDSVYIFSTQDDMEEVQQTIDAIYEKQETNQFGNQRYALLFLPGDYPKLQVKVGYYTQVMGLGNQPTDTRIGSIDCDATWLGDDPNNHNALCNFWRSVENVEIMGNSMWAVSQATDMRRVQVDGALYLHDNYGWASGGFLADSNIQSMVDSGSQQQWLSRNNTYRTWMGQNWNIVFAGDQEDGLPNGTWPMFSYTRADVVDVMREKPYLSYREGAGMGIAIPTKTATSAGCRWVEESQQVEWIPLDDCYIARADEDTAASINVALSEGKHILFTPGCYQLEDALVVGGDDTVLLGLGLASLEPSSGNACVETSSEGVTIAGLLFEAGERESDVLLHVGKPTENNSQRRTLLSDVYFRVGGRATAQATAVDTALIIDANEVVGDNLWVWRADHGDQVGWDANRAKHGVIINGEDVTMVALMVEHFQEEQTVWNGNGGTCIMYQSEVPYDIPSGEAKPSFYVSDSVKDFYATGLGIYLYNRDARIPLECGMRVPDAPGVAVDHIITVMLGNSHPGIHHVINEAGGSCMNVGETQKVLHYCNKEWK